MLLGKSPKGVEYIRSPKKANLTCILHKRGEIEQLSAGGTEKSQLQREKQQYFQIWRPAGLLHDDEPSSRISFGLNRQILSATGIWDHPKDNFWNLIYIRSLSTKNKHTKISSFSLIVSVLLIATKAFLALWRYALLLWQDFRKCFITKRRALVIHSPL